MSFVNDVAFLSFRHIHHHLDVVQLWKLWHQRYVPHHCCKLCLTPPPAIVYMNSITVTNSDLCRGILVVSSACAGLPLHMSIQPTNQLWICIAPSVLSFAPWFIGWCTMGVLNHGLCGATTVFTHTCQQDFENLYLYRLTKYFVDSSLV